MVTVKQYQCEILLFVNTNLLSGIYTMHKLSMEFVNIDVSTYKQTCRNTYMTNDTDIKVITVVVVTKFMLIKIMLNS